MTEGQMREAVENMAKHRGAALQTDRRGWTEQQWIDDAEKLMGDLHGSVTSLVNGHVRALLHRAERTTRVADLCHWRQNRGGCQDNWTHEAFHFGNPCPYEAVAAILRGERDPRDPMPPCPLCGPGYRLGDDGCRHTGDWRS